MSFILGLFFGALLVVLIPTLILGFIAKVIEGIFS